jgi:hypothetical protein
LATAAVRLVVNELKFEITPTFKVPTLATAAMRLVVSEFKFEIERTFRIPMFADGVARDDVFEMPDTFRDVRVPTDVMFGWSAWETTRATVAFATFPTRFDEFRDEIDDPFPAMFVNVAVPRT